MIIKNLVDEDFVNYKKPSMFIGFPSCTFKCEKECGIKCCQNSILALSPGVEITAEKIVERYLKNNLTSAIVCGGLEPFDSFEEVLNMIKILRKTSDDDVVIYTGYNKEEVTEKVKILRAYDNIYIKYGRFIPEREPHYDNVLGIKLASPNQYAEKIS